MNCIQPLRLWNYGYTKIITGLDWMPGPGNSTIPYHKRKDEKCQLIPCGQCRACRMEYANQWATRVMLETKTSGKGLFITFTYNEKYVPRILIKDKTIISYNNNGSIKEIQNNYTKYGFSERAKQYLSGTAPINKNTLYKKDLQDLNKRIRKKFDGDTIRFYGCGEYGEEYGRPHYHVAYWGLNKLDPKQCYDFRKNAKGNETWRSREIDECWSYKEPRSDREEIGWARIGNLEWESAAYIARYIMKKQKGKAAQFYKDAGIEPEYTVMSLKPGIGYEYFNENKSEIYKTDSVTIQRKGQPYTRKPPHYYDEMMKKEDPELMDYIKTKRQEAGEMAQNIITSHLNTDLSTYIKNCAEIYNRKTEVFIQRKGYDSYEKI